jgi:hypothetical protein
MGILKSLLGGTADLLEPEEDDGASPDTERRSALEAALDRVLAERDQQGASSTAPTILPANGSRLAVLDQRRAAAERRKPEHGELSEPLERRSGEERRRVPSDGPRPAAFGRRAPRSI